MAGPPDIKPPAKPTNATRTDASLKALKPNDQRTDLISERIGMLMAKISSYSICFVKDDIPFGA
jgi:hypothetical protein